MQQTDATFPWVQRLGGKGLDCWWPRFIAQAVPPERLFMELPWPEEVDFTQLQQEEGLGMGGSMHPI